MPKASKKTTDNLYQIAHDEIMDVRVKISKALANNSARVKVDEILADFTVNLPNSIIKYFN